MPAAPLGKAFITVQADVDEFPADLREKLKLALKEATEGVEFTEFNENIEKAGDEAAQRLGDEVEKEAEPRMKKAGEKAGKGFWSGLSGVWGGLAGAFLPTLIALGVEAGAALAPAVAGLAGAIPAAIVPAAASVGVLMLAFHGLGSAIKTALSGKATQAQLDQLKSLAPAARGFVLEIMNARDQLKGLQRDVQQAFFVQLQGVLTQIVKTSLPALRGGLALIAGDLGRIAAGVGNTLVKYASQLNTLLLGVHYILQSASPILSDFLRIFLELAIAAAPFVDSLTHGFAEALGKFADFIERANASGGLADFFNSALFALKQLGGLLSAAGGVIFGIVKALQATGGGGISFVVDLLHELSDFVKSPAGQGALVSLFQLLNQALSTLFQVIGPLLPAVGKLISDFAGPLTQVLKDLTPSLVAIADFIGKQPGLLEAAVIAWGAYKIAVAAADAVQAIFIAEEAATPWGLIILAIAAIVVGIILLVKHWHTIEEAGKKAWNAIKDAAVAVWHWLEGAAASVRDFEEKVGKFFLELPGKILGWLQSLPGDVAHILQDMVDQGAHAIGYGIGLWLNALFQLPGLIWQGLQAIPGLLRDLWHLAVQFVITEVHAGEDFLVDYFVKLPQRIGAWLEALPARMRAGWNAAWAVAKEEIIKGGEAALDWIGKLPGRIGHFFDNVGGAILGGLRSGINSVIKSFNKGIDDAAGPLHAVIPHIPLLAGGAIVKAPTVAMVGEAGPEAVIPLSNPARARELADQSGLTQTLLAGLQAGPTTVNVLCVLDTGDFIRVIDTRVTKGLDDEAAALATNSKSGGF